MKIYLTNMYVKFKSAFIVMIMFNDSGASTNTVMNEINGLYLNSEKNAYMVYANLCKYFPIVIQGP